MKLKIKNQQNKNWFFEKMNKLINFLPDLMKKK